MTLSAFDHVNVRTNQLDKMVSWYSDVLGLKQGARPNFPFPGAWMYLGDVAVVHLIGLDEHPGAGSEDTLKLEHFAFSANGRQQFENLLKARGEKFKTNVVADFGIVQYNIWDPDGNHIHVDFSVDEVSD